MDPSIIKEGDIITYKINNSTYVTHRVIEVFNNANNLYFKTKGDANNTMDKEAVAADSLVGKVFLRIPKLGYFTDFVTTPPGFILLLIIPSIILLSKKALSYIK